MSGIYYVDAAKWLREVGLTVVESGACAGWQSRARSSGGFANPPLGVQWHHTASKTAPENDVNWQINGSDDAPIGNATIMRDGSIWMIAAGASNTAGKGGPWNFSRGTCPLDSGNTRTWAFEVANNGVGEAWPQVQIDAYFAASNCMNEHFGNRPDDLFTHQAYAPTRKVDPATAAAVQGPWKPRSVTSSGSWSVDDVKAEASRRAGAAPSPGPTPPEPEPEPQPPSEDWMANLPTIKKGQSGAYVERMQHLLAAAGYMNPGNTANYDGVWGDGTENAKIKFDNDHGLTPSPPTDCGSKSWESLMTGRKW